MLAKTNVNHIYEQQNVDTLASWPYLCNLNVSGKLKGMLAWPVAYT